MNHRSGYGMGLLSAVAGAALSGGVILGMGGCGGDTSGAEVIGLDSGPDGMETDGTVDSESPVDSGNHDGTVPDASDAGVSPEASTDGGDGSAVLPGVVGYPERVVAAFCSRLNQCCLVAPSAWNQAACVSALESAGGFRNLSTYSASIGSSNIAFDASAGATCVSDISTIACGEITSAKVLQLESECYGALTGTVSADGGACITSLDCAPGLYCAKAAAGDAGVTDDAGDADVLDTGLPADGGTTTSSSCAPLLATGSPCSDPTSAECTYRGTPNAFCQFPGTVPGDNSPAQCAPTEPLEAGCASNTVCQSGLCGFPGCTSETVFADPGVVGGTCSYYVLQPVVDAGADAD